MTDIEQFKAFLTPTALEVDGFDRVSIFERIQSAKVHMRKANAIRRTQPWLSPALMSSTAAWLHKLPVFSYRDKDGVAHFREPL